MNPDYDILGTFELFKESNHGPVFSGYFPHHLITENYLTGGEHAYVDKEIVMPGEPAKVFVTFLTPEAYPNTLFVGKKISVQEASRVVGQLIIEEIYNPILEEKTNN